MKKLTAALDQLSGQNKFAFYLAFARVFLAFHLLKRLFFDWESLSILFSDQTFVVRNQSIFEIFGVNLGLVSYYFYPFFLFFVFVLCLLLFGIGKNFTVLLTYVCVKIYQELTGITLNGGDNLLIFIMLYMLFADSFQYFSLNKSKSSSGSVSNLFSNLAAFSIMLHLCLAYAVSAFHKIHADVWFNGTALYYILHLERFQGPINHWFYNNGFFITVGTYFTILFELLFPLFIWFRKFKPILFITGFFLHIGIYITMMIFDFEILFLSLYGFFIKNETWLAWYSHARMWFSRVFPGKIIDIETAK